MHASLRVLFSGIFVVMALPLSVSAAGTGTAWSSNATVASPARIIIPSLGINTTIEGVGVNEKGEMAVPSGTTNAVGWFKYGTPPGQVGSAVLDAHVFAAFSKLKYVRPGADVYVITATNQILHFIVAEKKTLPLATLSSKQLFRPTTRPDLNLITCAGSLTADHSTYDHRLIVYATLVG